MSFDPPGSITPDISRSVAKQTVNATGSIINKFTPVKISMSGMQVMTPDVEADIDAFVGVTRTDVPNGSNGEIVNSGIVEDVPGSYAPGESVFVSKTGGITNVKPSNGVAGFTSGDFVIKLGVITKNEGNPLLRDCILFVQIIGQL